MRKQDLKKLNQEKLLAEAEALLAKVEKLETSFKQLKQQRNRALDIVKGILDVEKDLLDQINGAVKSNTKLHNLHAQEYTKLVKEINTPVE